MSTMTEHKSKLAEKIEARKPHRKEFPLPGFPGIEGGKIVFQIQRNGEGADALVTAYGMRDAEAKKHAAMGENPTLFSDLSLIATLHRAARDPEKPDEFPAFPSPEWMRRQLHTHELSILRNLYNAFVAEVFPGKIELLDSSEKLLDFVRLVYANWKNDSPDVALAEFSHEVLKECFIRVCVFHGDMEAELKAVQAENAMLRAAGVKTRDEEPEPTEGALSVYAVRLLAETANTPLQNAMAMDAVEDIHTERQVVVAMRMLGWSENSPAWKRVIEG
jgi:hypothetical protein